MAEFGISASSAHDPYFGPDGEDEQPRPAHPLDGPESVARHAKLMEWLYEAREAQALNRLQMAIDEDFYDGDQLTTEELDELRQRGQPPIVYNLVKQYVDWIIGTERRMRVDFQVLPRGREDKQESETKTKLLKYNADVNRVVFHRSRAFKEAAVAGVGWLEDGARNDETEEVTYSRKESWRNVWYDHLAQEDDLSDARFLFRLRIVDLDVALAMFPDRATELRLAAEQQEQFAGDDEFFYSDYYQERDEWDQVVHRRPPNRADVDGFGRRRSRVRIYECEYREIANVQIMRGEEPFNGLDYDETNPAMAEAVQSGLAKTFGAIAMRVRFAVMTESHLLHDGPSPYRHNRFRFTPVWCYRRGRDRMPYGMIRNARDPQKALNKRMSKALHILSTNRIIADEDAMDSQNKWDEAIDEAARPDGVIRLSKPNARFDVDSDRDLADGHLKMLNYDVEFLRSGTGVTGENVGDDTSAQSGKAILAKQNEGSMTTAEVFDNLRLAVQMQGEKQLSIIEQFLGEARTIRVLGERGVAEYIGINQPQPDGTILNDITASKADFVVDQRDYRESVRQAMFESLMEVTGRLPPEVSLQLLDLVIDMSDIPNRDAIVARIRQINGQVDPDAQDDPDQIAARQQREQQDAEEAALVRRERESKIARDEAMAQEIVSKIGERRLKAIGEAAATAGKIKPETAGAADELLRSTGMGE